VPEHDGEAAVQVGLPLARGGVIVDDGPLSSDDGTLTSDHADTGDRCQQNCRQYRSRYPSPSLCLTLNRLHILVLTVLLCRAKHGHPEPCPVHPPE